jgi:RNA recognition motif-containing protein
MDANLAAEWERLRQERAQLAAERAQFQQELDDSGLEWKLFVGNLSPTAEEPQIRAHFQRFGKIKEIVVLRGREGKTKKSGFVKFYFKKEAENAVAEVNGKIHDGDEKIAMAVRPASQKVPDIGVPSSASAFNGSSSGGGYSAGGYGGYSSNFGMGAGGYAPYGPMPARPYDMYDVGMSGIGSGVGGGLAGGLAGGYGGGGSGSVSRPQATSGGVRPARGPPGSNLYVNKVPPYFGEERIRGMFEPFGNIMSITMFAGQGYSFVSYETPEAAQAAISALNGFQTGENNRLEVSLKKEGKGRPY